MRSNSTDTNSTSDAGLRLRVAPSSEFDSADFDELSRIELIAGRVPSSPRAFTLVEMLVVIAIIGILAALITPAIYQAMWSARQTKIKTELDQLASGMEAFKAKYGSYPPTNLTCPSSVANSALQSFVARVFPRYTVTAASLGAQIYNDLSATGTYQAGVDTVNINPQKALVFWLSGFGPDVTDPFNRANTNVTRTPFFTFDPTRLIDTTTNSVAIPGSALVGHLVYNAPYGSTAYAYFDYQSYGIAPTLTAPATAQYTGVTPNTVGPVFMSTTSNSNSLLLSVNTPMILSNGTGYVSPYFGDNNNDGIIQAGEQFSKPTSFQIISAGQDGSFGTTSLALAPNFRLFASGVGYDKTSAADDDNITNFNEKNSLDSAKP